MLENHAPIVSTLQAGVVKIKGNITLEESIKEQFETVSKDETLYAIASGTVEVSDNKIILLSD